MGKAYESKPGDQEYDALYTLFGTLGSGKAPQEAYKREGVAALVQSINSRAGVLMGQARELEALYKDGKGEAANLQQQMAEMMQGLFSGAGAGAGPAAAPGLFNFADMFGSPSGPAGAANSKPAPSGLGGKGLGGKGPKPKGM